MQTLKLVLDDIEFDALTKRAEAERRPITSQAAVLLRLGLGLPFPLDLANVRESAEKYAEECNQRMKMKN